MQTGDAGVSTGRNKKIYFNYNAIFIRVCC